MIQKIKDFYNALPQWVQKALTDAVESGIGAVVVLNLAFPHSIADAKALAVQVAFAFGVAVVAAIRRAIKAQMGIG